MRGRYTIAVLPGDGIGPEVTAEAVRVLESVGRRFELEFTLDHHPVGAAGVATAGEPLPPATRAAVLDADAVLLGAVGDPRLDHEPRHKRPETGLLALRALLGVYANLRPVMVHPALAFCSPLKPDRLTGVDLVIVRELTGGLYYGEPRGTEDGGAAAVNTLRYTAAEIERVARVAFELARTRRRRLLSVDKANVLETSQLWRDTVTRLAAEYPDVTLEHCYVDYAAMRLVSEPASIDVLLTENMFGDILSDEAAVLVGSLGLLPSASLGAGPGLFEPIHGSAPALAGRNVANPIGAIGAAALLLRHGLGLAEAADAVDDAIRGALAEGCRTRDIALPGVDGLGTREMGERIAELVQRPAARQPATLSPGASPRS
ncbi:MAG: 3-isopropylmalate dehydrogenase [Gemmatimonadetes bacterium]|nr:MAG: 3-isopropylmalate dehydrogenase [Gemmatimonadota bacterium]